MAEILFSRKAHILSKQIKEQKKTIVLAGGCFDILHPGHVIFLEKAKKAGDILIVLLESDETVRKLKGINRPVYPQKERARALSALPSIDYLLMLPFLKSDGEYDELISKIRPNVIAVTSKDINISHHQRSAQKIGAKLKVVTKIISNYSTSSLIG